MDNKIQIERLRYAKIGGERALFHDFWWISVLKVLLSFHAENTN